MPKIPAEPDPHSASFDEGALLIAQNGPFDGQRWMIKDKVLIGREADCEIVIAERQVSRHHARIYHSDNTYWVEDLNSKNGTHHNGVKVEDAKPLHDGDTIQIALVQQFRFFSSDATISLDNDLTAPLNQTPDVQQTKQSLVVDSRSRRVFVNDQEVTPPLSVAQFNLLETLYAKHGQVVSRSEIIVAIYGESAAQMISDQALDALVRRLRDRLAEINPDHAYILTVRGHGLRLDQG